MPAIPTSTNNSVTLVIASVFATAAALGGALGHEGLSGVGQGVLLTLAFVLEWGYFVFLESLWQGQSIGKRALKLRVVTSDGRALGFLQSVL